jgi:hypothetical protein
VQTNGNIIQFTSECLSLEIAHTVLASDSPIKGKGNFENVFEGQQSSGSRLLIASLSHDCGVQVSITCVAESANSYISVRSNILDSHHGLGKIGSRYRNVVE